MRVFACTDCNSDISLLNTFNDWQLVTCFSCMKEHKVKVQGKKIIIKGIGK